MGRSQTSRCVHILVFSRITAYNVDALPDKLLNWNNFKSYKMYFKMKPEKMLYIILHFLFILKKTHISPPVWPRPKYRGSKMNIGKTRLYRDFYSHRIFLKHLFWFFWSVARSLSRARLKDTKSCLDPDLDDFQNISIHLKVGQCQRTGAAFFFIWTKKIHTRPSLPFPRFHFIPLWCFLFFPLLK